MTFVTQSWGKYEVHQTKATMKSWGGVAIITKKNLKASLISEENKEGKAAESVWIQVGIHGKDLAIGGVYIPPIGQKKGKNR